MCLPVSLRVTPAFTKSISSAAKSLFKRGIRISRENIMINIVKIRRIFFFSFYLLINLSANFNINFNGLRGRSKIEYMSLNLKTPKNILTEVSPKSSILESPLSTHIVGCSFNLYLLLQPK